jgi:hypothetical protein
MSKLIGLNGQPLDGGQEKPMTLQERINMAENLWNCGKKNEGFQMALNAIAFLSQAIHSMGQNFRVVDGREAALAKSQQELGQNDQMLSAALANVDVRLKALEEGNSEAWKKGGGE